MSSVTIARNMKEIHPNTILMFRQGTFYHTFGKDAILLSYFFDYQIKTVEKSVANCGFPKNAINKVLARLEKEKINYILLDVKNNNDIEDEANFKNLNNYDKTYEKAKKIVNLKKRIYNIESYLLEEINSENINKKIIECENIIKESREILVLFWHKNKKQLEIILITG